MNKKLVIVITALAFIGIGLGLFLYQSIHTKDLPSNKQQKILADSVVEANNLLL